MKGYLTILRPGNCLMAGFAVLIGANVGGPLSFPVILAVGAAFLICGAGNVINDYYDYEIDLINKPQRPIPSGHLTTEGARSYAHSLFAFGVFISFFVNLAAFMMAIFNSLILYLYGAHYKRKGGLTKNLLVSYLVASPFLFGGLAVDNPVPSLFLLAIAFLVNTSREVVKDIEDYEGDSEHVVTLPIRIGVQASGMLAVALIALSILISPLPYTSGSLGFLYLPFIVVADIALIKSVPVFLRSPRLKAAETQRTIKIAMAFALLGFFLGGL